MGIAILIFLCLLITASTSTSKQVIKVKGGPESVIWVVQLSDLHFSVHDPDRATDFKAIVGPLLQLINPSLVLITGDLTDGKSEDLLTMKQNEVEWLEYQDVMDDVIKRSGLDKSIFYDLRGNHDNFGVPVVGGSVDFFSKHSINGRLGRRKRVNSVTIETLGRKHLFVGVDSTMPIGLRGPTNLFGHPTDQLLGDIDAELSQWESKTEKPVTKVVFGHFPLSFSASSHAGNSLRNIFLNHSLSVYLCGHLHSRFGKNLKRHHLSSQSHPSLELFQLNIHQSPGRIENCSFENPPFKEFWEWEMGDWRKSRAMRIMTIDNGHVSYMDIDLKSGDRKTIVVPTFPLDSRFMFTSLLHEKYKCQHLVPPSLETIRALVFSVSPIMSVISRIYHARPGGLDMVMESPMTKIVGNTARGDLYAAAWNYKAFEDPSPDRYWLQIEAIDIRGRSTLTELRPFSVSGQGAKISWTWKEFFVMGIQWASLYYPIFWSSIYTMLVILLLPKFLLSFFEKKYTYKTFTARKSFFNCTAWILQDLCRERLIWSTLVGYLIYLMVCPWFSGQVFTDSGNRTYMTHMGWVLKPSNHGQETKYIGFPDIMVIVLPHLFFVVLPAIVLSGVFLAERNMYKDHVLSCSAKKEDDRKRSRKHQTNSNNRPQSHFYWRWRRYILLLACLPIGWKHFKSCWALLKAYDMNPLLHFPVYSFVIPLVLVCTIYKTRRI